MMQPPTAQRRIPELLAGWRTASEILEPGTIACCFMKLQDSERATEVIGDLRLFDTDRVTWPLSTGI